MTKEEYLAFRAQRAGVKPHENETNGWWMQSHLDEIWAVIEEAQRLMGQVKIVLEIGTNHGGSCLVWDKLTGTGGVVITLDVLGLHSQYPIDPQYSPWRPLSDFHALLMDSHAPETLAAVQRILAGRSIDLLFIDGDHSYAGCKQDFEMYSPLVRSGGLVAIDDCVIMPHMVGRAWEEFPEPKKMIELPPGSNPGAHGMGLVYR